jgi:hypothetical protein
LFVQVSAGGIITLIAGKVKRGFDAELDSRPRERNIYSRRYK